MKTKWLKCVLPVWIIVSGIVSAQPAAEFTDDDILEAVEWDLRSDDAIAADPPNVEVNAGCVTLSGRAMTLLSKRRAVRLVGTLKGVRSIVDRIEVVPNGRSDQQILTDVNAALRDDPVTHESKIQVTVNSGMVVLEGTTDSFAGKRLTEEAVAGVRGVLRIDNRIAIGAEKDRTDNEIRQEILRRFKMSPHLAEGLIDIQVTSGVVTLRGTVGSINEQHVAGLLSWVAGVHDVDTSGLEAKAGLDRERRRNKFSVPRNDIELKRAVEDALLYDPRTRGTNIDVRVRNAAVSLLGNVSSLAAKRAAERDARNTLGVRRVINYLKVTVPDWPGDLAVTKRAQEALAHDAHLTDFDLRASSHSGTIYLRGEVNTHFEKDRAEVVVANVPGVLDVANRIKVDVQWQPKPDEEIQEDTERHLRWSPLLNASQIAVSVTNGVVTLQGTLDTWHEKTTAGRHAYQAGARSVTNKLDLRSSRDTPPGLKATLVPNQVEYELDSKFRGAAFRKLLESAKLTRDTSRLPPAPEVDLVFQLHNEGNVPVDVRLGHDKSEFELSIVGEGAVHVPLGRSFVADFRIGRVITIAPDEDFRIPIRSLQYGFRNASDRWYWTEPGEHLLQVTLVWPADIAGFNMNAVAATPITLLVDDEQID